MIFLIEVSKVKIFSPFCNHGIIKEKKRFSYHLTLGIKIWYIVLSLNFEGTVALHFLPDFLFVTQYLLILEPKEQAFFTPFNLTKPK